MIDQAMAIAVEAYSGQTDKAGKTYILHPLRIMHQMETEAEMVVALLHDVIEDSDFTAQDLLDRGISTDVVEAVEMLTKGKSEDYMDFIDRVKTNPLAARVKKADIEDNINVLRLGKLEANDLERVKKYHKAWHRLTQ